MAGSGIVDTGLLVSFTSYLPFSVSAGVQNADDQDFLRIIDVKNAVQTVRLAANLPVQTIDRGCLRVVADLAQGSAQTQHVFVRVLQAEMTG